VYVCMHVYLSVCVCVHVCVCVCVCLYVCLCVCVHVFRPRTSYDAQSGYAVMGANVVFVYGVSQTFLPLLVITH
jgi:hypothetical protein